MHDIRRYKVGKETTIDTLTGLMWEKYTNCKRRTWQEADQYCRDLELEDFKDWRLPRLKEFTVEKKATLLITAYFNETGWHAYTRGILDGNVLKALEDELGENLSSFMQKANGTYSVYLFFCFISWTKCISFWRL